MKLGFFAGLTMALIVIIFNLFGGDSLGISKYLKYVALVIFLVSSALQLVGEEDERNFTSAVMFKGLIISVIAGVVFASLLIFIFLINSSTVPVKFNVIPDSWSHMITIAIYSVIEIIISGGIINFVIIQWTKPKVGVVENSYRNDEANSQSN